VASLFGVVAPAPASAAGPRDPLLIVGDSLCVGARDFGANLTQTLRDIGWDPEYACQVGMPMSWGIDQVRARAAVPATVVVALGTNPGPTETDFAARLDTMRTELRSRGAQRIIWVDFTNRADAYATKNRELLVSAYVHGDFAVDWASQIRPNPQWFALDGLHYTLDGQKAWASAVAAVTRIARDQGPGVAAALDRLYLAFFGRLADDEGRRNWTNAITNGMWFDGVADRFAQSEEYRLRYGAPDNAQFVELAYRNVLDRAPDPAGYANWTALLDAGRTRGWVMARFAESDEFVARATALIEAIRRPQVERLYLAFFGRNADPQGMDTWLYALQKGDTLDEVAELFAQSQEFRNRYGDPDDARFVELAYRNVLDRAPDPAGYAHWTALLAAGRTRGWVMERFAESAEFKARTAGLTG
jgi:hypothetical protein